MARRLRQWVKHFPCPQKWPVAPLTPCLPFRPPSTRWNKMKIDFHFNDFTHCIAHSSRTPEKEKYPQAPPKPQKRSQNNEQEKPEINVNALGKGKVTPDDMANRGTHGVLFHRIWVKNCAWEAGFSCSVFSVPSVCAWPLPVFVHELERNVTFHSEHRKRWRKKIEAEESLPF